MAWHFTGLWRNSDFTKFWAGETVSFIGSAVTSLALPLTAVVVLKASPAQMGILGATQFAPFLVLGLFAGVWVDRLPRRPLLILADLGRMLLLGSIPLTSVLNLLSIEYLYVIGTLIGILTLFFEVAVHSYLPDLVQPEQLVEGNTKLEVSRSLAQVIGPGLAGLLVQLITAPFAIVVDALSFGISALTLNLVRTREPQDPANREHSAFFIEIKEGIEQLLNNPVTRSLAFCGTTRSFFSSIMTVVSTLYFVNELKIAPFVIGLISAAGGIGTLLGAIVAAKVAQRFGLGRALISGALLVGLGNLLIPAASGSLIIALPLLVAGLFISSLAAPIYGVNQLSLRQTITPPDLLGRVNATVRFMAWGALALGSFAGGLLGTALGLRLTLLIGAAGTLFSFLWIFLSPTRNLDTQPAPSTD